MIPVLVAGAGFGLTHVELLTQAGFDVRYLLVKPTTQVSTKGRLLTSTVAKDINDIDLSEVQLASVATPPESHYDIVSACLHAGVDVVCDKPLAPSYTTAVEMAELAEESPARCAMFFQWRFYGPFGILRRAIQEDMLGELKAIHIHSESDFLHSRETKWPWRHRLTSSGGGALNDLGVHGVDLVRWLTGSEILFSSSTSFQKYQWRDIAANGSRIRCETEDAVHIIGRLTSGSQVELHASRVARRSMIYLALVGSKAEVRISCNLNGHLLNVISNHTGLRNSIRDAGVENPYTGLVNAWYNSPFATDARIATFRDGAIAAQLVEKAISHQTTTGGSL